MSDAPDAPLLTSHRTAVPDALPPAGGLSLKRNFSWTLLGNVVYAGSQWAWLVVIAKMSDVATAGVFALGLAIATPVIVLANMNLRVVQANDVREQYRFGHYLALRLAATLLALCIIAGILVASPYAPASKLVVGAVALFKAMESFSDVLYGLQQQHERMDCIAKSMLLRGPLSVLALALGLYGHGSVLWGALGIVLAWGVVVLLYDIPNGRRLLHAQNPCADRAGWGMRRFGIAPHWDWPVLWRLALYALPVGMVLALVSFNLNIPRYVLEHVVGARALGIFAAIACFAQAGEIVARALGQSATPRLARHYACGERRAFRNLLGKLCLLNVAIGLLVMLVVAFCGRYILTVVYSREYAAIDNTLFMWLMVAALLTNLTGCLGTGVTSMRCFYPQVAAYALNCGVMAAASFVCIRHSGLSGAIIALVISSGVLLLLYLALTIYAFRRFPVAAVPGNYETVSAH